MGPRQVCSSLFSSSNPFKRAATAHPPAPAPMPKKPKSTEKEQEQEEEEEEEEEVGIDSDEPVEQEQGEPRYDSQEKLQRTIFVGNLPLSTKKKLIARTFSCFGDVDSVRLRSVPIGTTKMSRRGAVITGNVSEQRSSLHAYIVFKRVESATLALTYNMTEFGGKHIRVDLAGARSHLPSGGVLYDKTRSIFVGNLPVDVEDEELYALFSCPDVELEAVRVVRDQKTNIGKGFAFVLFKSKENVKATLKRAPLELRDRKLRLHRVNSNSCGIKGKTDKQRRPCKPTPSSRTKSTYEGTRSGHKRHGPVQRLDSTDKAATSEGKKKKRPAVLARKAKERSQRQHVSNGSIQNKSREKA